MNYSTIFCFIMLFGLMGIGFMHEQVHAEIYKSYGIESHVEYFSHFPDLVTIAEEPCPTESCNLAHNINEAITYPLTFFYFALMIGILSIIIIIEDKKTIEDKNG